MASLADDWKAYYNNNEYRTKEETREFLQKFFEEIPDINVDIKQIAVEGDIITVRSEMTGTPKGDFLGVPHSGRSFRIMTIDFNRVKDGKLIELYHVESWTTAIEQLRGISEDQIGHSPTIL
jgi:steroid delta-isomerase-like uncharacterized protein